MDQNISATRIVEQVARRGYLPEDRPAWQIQARQTEKLTEELGELVACLESQLNPWTEHLYLAATQAKLDFDADDGWTNTPPPTGAELADMLVALRVAEWAINQARDTDYSLDEAALAIASAERSADDIERGVRAGGQHG